MELQTVKNFCAKAEQFLNKAKPMSPHSNSWVEESGVKAYLRADLSPRTENNQYTKILTIAAIEVDPELQGQGIGTSVISELHKLHDFNHTKVECVHNSKLANWLSQNGFTPIDGGESWIK